jgi:macrodomain Ter protein organizer (MatP/YcbG family)
MKKIRSVRVSDQLWRKAQAKARKEGKSLSEAIVDFLKQKKKEYVK